MQQLVHLIYASAATRKIEETEVLRLLQRARVHNREMRITGMLLFTGESFFQILEGPEHAVNELFRVIQRDTRHSKITRIIQEPIPDRAFAEWSMAYAGVLSSVLASVEGMNDFFETGNCLLELDGGRAQKLLRAFSQGRWRKTLS